MARNAIRKRRIPNRHLAAREGATLVEILLATLLAALAVAIAYPSLHRGLAGVQLWTEIDDARSFLVRAQQVADRRQQAVLVRIDPGAGRIDAVCEDGRWERALAFATPLRIARPAEFRTAVLYPGGLLADLQFMLRWRDGPCRGFRVDVRRGTFVEVDDCE